jgi:PII-like signaling protein
MENPDNSVLKIYASSTDKLGTRLLYEHIVLLAKEKGISGVTVYRGIMGYGKSSSHISTSRYWELTEKLPIMIELVDTSEMLERFFQLIEPDLLKTRKGYLVTLEPVKVLLQKPGSKTPMDL